MSVLEIIAVFFSLVCVWLSVKKNVLNWPIGLVGVCAYLLLFYQHKLYADMALQVLFIVQGLYGWYNWKNNQEKHDSVKVSIQSNNGLVVYAAVTILVAMLWGYLLKRYTDDTVPYLDAVMSSISLSANLLMARRKMENWYFWIIADMGYVGLFIYKQLYLSSAIYTVFLVLAIMGLLEWKKQLNTRRVSY